MAPLCRSPRRAFLSALTFMDLDGTALPHTAPGLKVLVLLGHWDVRNLGCQAQMDMPDLCASVPLTRGNNRVLHAVHGTGPPMPRPTHPVHADCSAQRTAPPDGTPTSCARAHPAMPSLVWNDTGTTTSVRWRDARLSIARNL